MDMRTWLQDRATSVIDGGLGHLSDFGVFVGVTAAGTPPAATDTKSPGALAAGIWLALIALLTMILFSQSSTVEEEASHQSPQAVNGGDLDP
jgi:hypothetical protein